MCLMATAKSAFHTHLICQLLHRKVRYDTYTAEVVLPRLRTRSNVLLALLLA